MSGHLSPLQQTAERAAQVAELLATIPAAQALNRDQTLFEVPIILPDGTSTTLRISLPPGFPAPTSPPSLSLSANGVRHTWVDAGTGRVTCPALARWGAGSSGSSGPPKVAGAVQEVLAGLGASVVGGGGAVGAPATTTTVPAPSISSPEEAEFPELAGADAATLEQLVTDEAAFAALAARVAARVGVSATGLAAAAAGGADPAAAAEAAALAAAQANLAAAAGVAELRNQVAVIRAGEYASAVEGAASRAARAAAVTAALSPAALVAGLRAAAAAADAESARCYDAFLSTAGAGAAAGAPAAAVDQFTGAYVKLRTKFHERELKQQAASQTLA